MTRLFLITSIITSIAFTLAACSDDGGTLADGPRPDVAVVDQTPIFDESPDAPVPDLTRRDALAPDLARRDTAPIPDAPPVVDLGPAPDGPQTSCTQDTQCKVFEDCCDCRAEYVWVTSPICKMACTVKACTTEAGIKLPKAYCLKGQCLLAESAVGCTVDTECKKVDDCCYCMAVPTSTTPQTCPNMCLVDTCTGIGLANATAKCVSGTCRLVP